MNKDLSIYSDICMPKASKVSQDRTLDDVTAGRVAELFRAFSDASRVRILSALIEGEVSVGALAEAIGISESAVSHHLRSLRQLRLVRARKDGQQVFYSVDDDHIVALFQQVVQHVRHA
jgi:DNA-binding transcriptional ArsR family regulator